MPSGEHTAIESAGVDGALWRHWHTDPREVFWPLMVWEDTSSQAWLDYDAAFWKTMDPRYPGKWVVTQPNGTQRTLVCRFVSDGGGAGDFAPGAQVWAKYGITLQAEQPYWASPQVTKWFKPSTPVPFIPEGGGPPFTISEGSSTASARVANKGDIDSSATWWITDVTSIVVGAGTKTIVVPFAVDDDRLLVIDTNPDALSAIEIDLYPPDITEEGKEAWVTAHLPDGLDRTPELGAATQFGAIPSGKFVDLTIAMVGTGSVRVAFTPLHWRAW